MTTREAIKAFLRSEGITQTALAAAYGCTASSMSEFLSGRRPIPDEARIIAALSAIISEGVILETTIYAREGEVTHTGVWLRRIEQ